jgi:hypothetical protein
MKDVFARKRVEQKIIDWYLKDAKRRLVMAENMDIDEWIEEKLMPLCRFKLPSNLPRVE